MLRGMMVAVLKATPEEYKTSSERSPMLVKATSTYEVEPDAFGLFGALGDFESARRITYWDRRHHHIERLRASNRLRYTPYPGFLIAAPDGKRHRVRDDLNSAWTTADALRAGTVDHKDATTKWLTGMIDDYPRALDMLRAIKCLSAEEPDAIIVLSWNS